MNNDWKQKLALYISIIAGICSILGISVIGVYGKISKSTRKNYEDTKKIEKKIENDKEYSRKKQDNIVDYVNYYVINCKNKIFPIKEWNKFSLEELYYIRNGIYAYEGMKFEKEDFFEKFNWYHGETPYNDFPEGKLNYNQNKNVANIEKVEHKKIVNNIDF